MTPTPDVAALTQFDYLLNAFEQASQADAPAEHGYGAKRRALFAHVRQLERDSVALRAAEQRAEAAEADATMYRALRQLGEEAQHVRMLNSRGHWLTGDAFDAAISAHLKQGEQPCEPL